MRYHAVMNMSGAVRERAIEIGFDLAGIAPFAAWKDLEFSRKWVERGFGGEMRYLENPRRDDPRRVLPSLQSVVCVGLIYNAPLPYSTEVRNQESEVRSRIPEGRSRNPGVGSRESDRKLETQILNPRNRQPETCDREPANDEGPRTNDQGPRAWISRYAWGRDYHQVMRERLEKLRAGIEALAPGVQTRVYVDTGPIVERAFARLSGIGWTGKNTCLINEAKGSWFFLGVILTNLALEPGLPAPDRCGTCMRCLEACPTGALVEPYVMDASRCIAYLNIELRGAIPEKFRSAIGANVFGCDICQDVCPWNGRSQKGTGNARHAAITLLPEFQPIELCLESAAGNLKLESQVAEPIPQKSVRNRPPATARGQSSESPAPGPRARAFSLFNPPLESLAALSEKDFRTLFRRSPIQRAKYRGWLRNLAVAMGNSGDPRFVPRLEELAAHSDPVVREHATWALARLAAGRENPR